MQLSGILAGTAMLLVACGAAPYLTMAHPDNLATRELERLEAETAAAKREAQAAWLNIECQACLLRDYYVSRAAPDTEGDVERVSTSTRREVCRRASDDDSERDLANEGRALCEQVGCHPLGDFANCQAFIDNCRAGGE